MSMKTVFITGGSRGIGTAAVRKFYNEGWQVAFCYNRSEQQAHQLVSELPGATAIQCDISDADSANRLCREALEKLGHIDALVLNAAAALPQKLITDTVDNILLGGFPFAEKVANRQRTAVGTVRGNFCFCKLGLALRMEKQPEFSGDGAAFDNKGDQVITGFQRVAFKRVLFAILLQNSAGKR